MYQRVTLKNGMRVICERIPQVHSVSLGVWVGSGSRYEELEHNGISHFIEHMLFKGTAKRSARQIAEAIDAVGGQLNAFTTKEYTCYYAKVLNQHFRIGLDLLSDMVTNSVFDPVELEKEKSVVLEEIKSFEDSPDEIIHDLLAGSVLKGHPLGWTILGNPETVGAINQQRVLNYLEQHYTPDNIVFAVAGNIHFDQILPEIEERFGRLRGSFEQKLPPLPSMEPSCVVRNKDTEQVHLCIGTRGFSRKNNDKYSVFVMDSILGGSVSSRLFQQLREERGLVYAAGSSHASFRDTGIFSIYAGTSPGHLKTVAGLINKELVKLQQEPVSPEELKRAKEQLKGNLLLSLENTCNRMSRIAKLELFRDPLQTPKQSVAKIDAVTCDDVQRVARQMFGRKELVFAAVGPIEPDSAVIRKAYHEFQ